MTRNINEILGTDNKYLLQEMSLLGGVIGYALKSVHKFNPAKDDYKKQDGWDAFYDFLKNIYYKSGNSFVKILKAEKIGYPKQWDDLDRDDKIKVDKFIQKLDGDVKNGKLKF